MVSPITNLSTYESIFETDAKFIPTGVGSFDNMTNDLPTKKLTVITGVPKEGKSTFLHRIALNAVDKKYRVFLVDGEHDRTTLINQLYRMAIGNMPNAYIKKKLNKFDFIEPKPHVLKKLQAWHEDRLQIFSKYLSPFNTLEALFDMIASVVQAHDIDLVIYDNLMMLVDGTSVEKNENQSKFVKRVCDLNKKHNVHSIIVAHPNKGAKQGEPMGIYDVLGSSDIVNMVDYLVQVMRNYDRSVEADAYARILLNRTMGRNIGDIPLKFDRATNSLFEMGIDGQALTYHFDLDRNGGEQGCLDTPF